MKKSLYPKRYRSKGISQIGSNIVYEIMHNKRRRHDTVVKCLAEYAEFGREGESYEEFRIRLRKRDYFQRTYKKSNRISLLRGKFITRFRKKYDISVKMMADLLDVHPVTVRTWEKDVVSQRHNEHVRKALKFMEREYKRWKPVQSKKEPINNKKEVKENDSNEKS